MTDRLDAVRRARRAWGIDDKSDRRGVDALVFTFAVTVLLRGFEANPGFAVVMAAALGLYARFVLGIVVEEYGGSTPGTRSSA